MNYLVMDNNDTMQMTANTPGTASGFATLHPCGEPGNGATSAECVWTNQILGPNGVDHFWRRDHASPPARRLSPDPAGRAVTVLDQNGNWLRGEVFAGGRHIATYVNNTTNFDYSDWLGTERLTATLSGTEQDACTSLPYGDDFACSGPGSDPSPLHFTGQQHDNETGLDHFPARYYTSTWGVWTTPDWSRSPTGVPYATLSDPQSLDLYNYTLGNPETNTDPDGHWCFLGIGTTCPPSRTSSSGVGGNGPGAFGPRWFQECEADLQCGSMNVWPFLESAVGQAQFDLKHPYIGGAVLTCPQLLVQGWV